MLSILFPVVFGCLSQQNATETAVLWLFSFCVNFFKIHLPPSLPAAPPFRFLVLPLSIVLRRLRAVLRMVTAKAETAAKPATGPSRLGTPLRIGMFGGGTVGGGVYEICEQASRIAVMATAEGSRP